jgi:hypothetical protein
MNSIEKAKDVVRRLQDKLVQATDRATELATKRRRISFNAHSGDALASEALAEATAESTRVVLEIENIRFAISEAEGRIPEAEREMREERERARKAPPIIARAGKRGPKMQAHLKALCDELSSFGDDLQELKILGAPSTTGRLIELAVERAIATPMRATGMVRVDMVPPGLRIQLDTVVGNYLTPSTRWVAALLGESGVSADSVEAA